MHDTRRTNDMRHTVSRLILDRIEKGAQAGFSLWRKPSLLITIYSRRCLMQKLIVIGFAALCLIGTSSLALADEAMMGEMGNMKAEKDAMKSDGKAKKEAMKGQTKVHKEKIKAKSHETKGKMKAQKHTAKAKVGAAKGTTQSVE
jgi:Sec-independent protein translocase protein TatA